MTSIITKIGMGGDEPQQLQLTFTWPQAKQSDLVTYEIFKVTEPLAYMLKARHLQAGTPHAACEPTELAGHLLSTPYNVKLSEELDTRLSEDLDPLIQENADRGEDIATTGQALAERDPKITSAETGLVYTEADAVHRVESNQAKINADKKRGRAHHQRVRRWLRVLGKIMPYGEALGLIALLTYWLNVEWTDPLQDPLTWSLSLIIVAAVLLFTPRVVERTGEGWNERREAVAEAQTEAKRAATKKIVLNGFFAAVISVAVVAGLVERALAVTDDTMPDSMALLLFSLCVVAGLAMPALALVAKAWDGSSLSRENDSLVKQLDAGLEEDQQLRSEAMSLHLACEQVEIHINTEIAPALLRIAEDIAEEMRRAYAWLCIQIGGSGSAPPALPVENRTGTDRNSIFTGIPGAEPLRLEPLVSRGLRIQELQRSRGEAIAKLQALPRHPWAGNQDRS